MRKLGKIIKDKLNNQVLELDKINGDKNDNAGTFESYKSQFDNKVIEWCDNEIRDLTTEN